MNVPEALGCWTFLIWHTSSTKPTGLYRVRRTSRFLLMTASPFCFHSPERWTCPILCEQTFFCFSSQPRTSLSQKGHRALSSPALLNVQLLFSSSITHCGSLGLQKHFGNHSPNTLMGTHRVLLQIQMGFSSQLPQSILHKQQARSNVLTQFIYKRGKCEWRLQRDVKY